MRVVIVGDASRPPERIDDARDLSEAVVGEANGLCEGISEYGDVVVEVSFDSLFGAVGVALAGKATKLVVKQVFCDPVGVGDLSECAVVVVGQLG